MTRFCSLLICVVPLVINGCDSHSQSDSLSDATNQAVNQQNKPKVATLYAAPASTPQPTITTLNVAAISNLKMVLPILISDFNNSYPNIKVQITFGTNKSLYDKIVSNRHAYDIYLSGNQQFAKQLANQFPSQAGIGKYSQPFTYTRGQLVLYSHKVSLDSNPTTVLDEYMQDNKPFKIAISDPQNISYGSAAETWLINQNLYEPIKDKIVRTNNIEETFNLTDKGTTDFGFVVLSQVLDKPANNTLQQINSQQNDYLILPKDSYPPILQDGYILNQPEASAKFVQYLESAKAQDALSDAGFLPICTTSNLLPACK